MKIDIERIKVDETTRIRQEIGDLLKLEESIRLVGLINPVLIDENDVLVAGFRRLRACKNLGWKEIEVNVVQLEGDELKMLEAEAAENLFRKEFTHDEILAIHHRRLEIEENRRHKGWFERFWRWLKSLFQPKADQPAAGKPQPAPPVPEEKTKPPRKDELKPEAEPPKEPAAEAEKQEEAQSEPEKDPPEEPVAEVDKQEEPQAEPEKDPQPAAEPAAAAADRPRTPEITEKDGVRHIKWR